MSTPTLSPIDGTAYEKERAFSQAFRFTKNRIAAFFSLPLATIDRMSLTSQLRGIGGLEGTTTRQGKAG